MISSLKIRIMVSPALEDFIKLFEVWQRTTMFMGICYTFKIKDIKDEIKNKMTQCEEDVSNFKISTKILCKYGKSSILYKKEYRDKDFLHARITESHAKQAESLWSTFKLVLGCCSTQGFE